MNFRRIVIITFLVISCFIGKIYTTHQNKKDTFDFDAYITKFSKDFESIISSGNTALEKDKDLIPAHDNDDIEAKLQEDKKKIAEQKSASHKDFIETLNFYHKALKESLESIFLTTLIY